MKKVQILPYSALLMLWITVAVARINYQTHITTSGIIADVNLSVDKKSIDWGIVYPGGSSQRSIKIKNTGTVSVVLSLGTANFSPANASSYMSLNWDYDGSQVLVDQIVTITLTLSVNETISGIKSFSFDIVIGVSG